MLDPIGSTLERELAVAVDHPGTIVAPPASITSASPGSSSESVGRIQAIRPPSTSTVTPTWSVRRAGIGKRCIAAQRGQRSLSRQRSSTDVEGGQESRTRAERAAAAAARSQSNLRDGRLWVGEIVAERPRVSGVEVACDEIDLPDPLQERANAGRARKFQMTPCRLSDTTSPLAKIRSSELAPIDVTRLPLAGFVAVRTIGPSTFVKWAFTSAPLLSE